jgi:hypothetical protein
MAAVSSILPLNVHCSVWLPTMPRANGIWQPIGRPSVSDTAATALFDGADADHEPARTVAAEAAWMLAAALRAGERLAPIDALAIANEVLRKIALPVRGPAALSAPHRTYPCSRGLRLEHRQLERPGVGRRVRDGVVGPAQRKRRHCPVAEVQQTAANQAHHAGSCPDCPPLATTTKERRMDKRDNLPAAGRAQPWQDWMAALKELAGHHGYRSAAGIVGEILQDCRREGRNPEEALDKIQEVLGYLKQRKRRIEFELATRRIAAKKSGSFPRSAD